jgi:hypothetical protein
MCNGHPRLLLRSVYSLVKRIHASSASDASELLIGIVPLRVVGLVKAGLTDDMSYTEAAVDTFISQAGFHTDDTKDFSGGRAAARSGYVPSERGLGSESCRSLSRTHDTHTRDRKTVRYEGKSCAATRGRERGLGIRYPSTCFRHGVRPGCDLVNC